MGEKTQDLIINGNQRLKDLKVVELKLELEKRGLPKYGTKKELLQRLSNFEESKQKTVVAKAKQETPNQWIEEDSNLANDFIRDYFKSQKALLAEHIVHNSQRGECDAPATITDSSAIKEPALDDAKPSCSRKASSKASNKHETALPEPCPTTNKRVKLTIRKKCDPVISPRLGRQSKNNAEYKILSCSLLEESQDGDELEVYHRSRRKRHPSGSTKPPIQKVEEEKKPLTKLLKIKIGSSPMPLSPSPDSKKVSNPSLVLCDKTHLSPQNAEISSSVEEQTKSKLVKSISPSCTTQIPPKIEELSTLDPKMRVRSNPGIKSNLEEKSIKDLARPKSSTIKTSQIQDKSKIAATKPSKPISHRKAPSTKFLKATGSIMPAPTANKRPTRNLRKPPPTTQIVGPSKKNSSIVNRPKGAPNISELKKCSKVTKPACSNVTKKPEKKPTPTTRSELFESLKQQIEMPLYVEKFPSKEKIEVSSTSELSDQFMEPIYDFHSTCPQTRTLDSQIIVDSHLGSDTIPDSRTSNDDQNPLTDPLQINAKDLNPLSVLGDNISTTECVQKISDDLGSVLGKPKKDSYLMKNLLKESELPINCLPHLEEVGIISAKREGSSASEEKLPSVARTVCSDDPEVIKVPGKSVPHEDAAGMTDICLSGESIELKDANQNIKQMVKAPAPSSTEERTGVKMDILEAATLAADIDKSYDSKKNIPTQTQPSHVTEPESEIPKESYDMKCKTDDSVPSDNIGDGESGYKELPNAVQFNNQVEKSTTTVDDIPKPPSLESSLPQSSVGIESYTEPCTKFVNTIKPENSTKISPNIFPDASTTLQHSSSSDSATPLSDKNVQPHHDDTILTDAVKLGDASELQKSGSENLSISSTAGHSHDADIKSISSPEINAPLETDNQVSCILDVSIVPVSLDSKSIYSPESVNMPLETEKEPCMPDVSRLPVPTGDTEACILDVSIAPVSTGDAESWLPDASIVPVSIDIKHAYSTEAVNIPIETDRETCIPDASQAPIAIGDTEVCLPDASIAPVSTGETEVYLPDASILPASIDSKRIYSPEAVNVPLETDRETCIPDASIAPASMDSKRIYSPEAVNVPLETDRQTCIPDASIAPASLDSKSIYSPAVNMPLETDREACMPDASIVPSICKSLPEAVKASQETLSGRVCIPHVRVPVSTNQESKYLAEAGNVSLETDSRLCIPDAIVIADADSKGLCTSDASTNYIKATQSECLPNLDINAEINSDSTRKLDVNTSAAGGDNSSLVIPVSSIVFSEVKSGVCIPDDPKNTLNVRSKNVSIANASLVSCRTDNTSMCLLNESNVCADTSSRPFCLTDENAVSPESNSLEKKSDPAAAPTESILSPIDTLIVEDVQFSLLQSKHVIAHSEINSDAAIAEEALASIPLPASTWHPPKSVLSESNIDNSDSMNLSDSKETKCKLDLPSLVISTVSEAGITACDAEAALTLTDPSSVDTFISHNVEDGNLCPVEMSKRRKSKSSTEDHKKAKHDRDDLSPPREKVKKLKVLHEKDRETVSAIEHKTPEESTKDEVCLDANTKCEEEVPENNHHQEIPAKEIQSLPEENKATGEAEKKAHSRSRRRDSSKESHRQRSKDKRRSRSRSLDKDESRKRKKSAHRSDDRHSSDKSSRKSRKREDADGQHEQVAEPAKSPKEKDVDTVTSSKEKIPEPAAVTLKETTEDALEILLNPEPDSSLLEEDTSMDMTSPKPKITEGQIKVKRERHSKRSDHDQEAERIKENEPFKSVRKVTLNRNKLNGESRKRKWGSNKEATPSMGISSFSLRDLISDVKPLSPSELKLETESDKSSGDEAPPAQSRDQVNGRVDEPSKEEPASSDDAKESLGRPNRQQAREAVARDARREKHSRRDAERRDDSRRRRHHDEKGSTRQSRSFQIVEAALPPTKLGIPISRYPISRVIVVSNLVRPFTVKQLKDLLQRTGTLTENGFWIDNIKSKCIAMFEEEDQAEETRIALHGVKWPSVNPKRLLVDFSNETDLKKKLSETPHLNPIIVEDSKFERRKIDRPVREWDVAKMGERSPGEKEREREKQRRHREQERTRERMQEQSPKPEKAPVKKQLEVKSLDDLFSKTRAQPSVYWLPLTTEEIGEKEAMRRKKMAEQERRETELKAAHEKQRAERLKERERQRRRDRSRSPRRFRRSASSGRRRRSKSRSRSRS